MSLLVKLRSLQEEYNPLWKVKSVEFIAAVDHYPTFGVIVVRGIFEISIPEIGVNQVTSTSLELLSEENIYKARGITMLYY